MDISRQTMLDITSDDRLPPPTFGQTYGACTSHQARDKACSDGHGARFADIMLMTESERLKFIKFLLKETEKPAPNSKATASSAIRSIYEKIQALNALDRNCAIVFIGSPIGGYVIRSDIVSFRMRSFRSISTAIDLAHPGCWAKALPWNPSATSDDWESILECSLGALVIDAANEYDLLAKMSTLPRELTHRLSVPLTMKNPTSPKRVCVIGGGLSMAYRRSLFNTATALRISLVIVDKPDHWLQNISGVCEAFLPVNMTVNDGFIGRVLEALRSYGRDVDGITTLTDRWLEKTAQIALALKLPTQSPKALSICTEKEEFRRLSPILECPSLCITSVEDFMRNKETVRNSYPLIVKPSNGANSLGVNKVDNETEAETLVRKLLPSFSSILLERYIDGPEVDVNVVMVDGEVTFCDIDDEPPSTAEVNPTQSNKSFLEEQVIWPSILPATEQAMLRQQTFSTLKAVGLTEGVFHVEARLINSKKKWIADCEGTLTLADSATDEEPSCMIIEINPRCVGYPGAIGVEHAHGIDYAALQVLLALGDQQRARILSHPFSGMRETCVVSDWITATHGGQFQGDNMFKELKTRRSDLVKWLVEQIVYFKDGDVIPEPRGSTPKWLALFTVRSDIGRDHARKICKEIKSEVRYGLVDENLSRDIPRSSSTSLSLYGDLGI